MALAELAELQTQPLPTPLSPQDACSSRWPSREGATPPQKAPAQLQGVRAEGLLPEPLKGGPPLMPLPPGGPGGSNEQPISFEGVGFQRSLDRTLSPRAPAPHQPLTAWGKEGELGQEGRIWRAPRCWGERGAVWPLRVRAVVSEVSTSAGMEGNRLDTA